MVDGARLNDRTWDFLLESHSSPLSAKGTTIFFQRLEEAPPQRRNALLSLIDETGLARRLWLIFSCNSVEDQPLSDYFKELSLRRLRCICPPCAPAGMRFPPWPAFIRDHRRRGVPGCSGKRGNPSLTARQLCISRTTLWRILSQSENYTPSN